MKKHFIVLQVGALLLSSSAYGADLIEKFEKRYPQKVGDFLLTSRAVVPAATRRVMFEYKVPGKASATLVFTALHPDRETLDVNQALREATEQYAASETTRTILPLPKFAEGSLGKGCGPRFEQLNFESKGRVYSMSFFNFAAVVDRHLVRILVLQDGKSTNGDLAIEFLNKIRSGISSSTCAVDPATIANMRGDAPPATAAATPASTPQRIGSDIVEQTPNLIVKANSFGTELAIESESIVERTQCKPAWPVASLRNEETGAVKISFLISATGFANRAKVIDSSGFRDLDRATMVGFLGCKFKPFLKDGWPADTWHDMTYVWKIE